MGQDVSIKGVVLAGAQDWGDCPLRLATPRPLAPVANQPLLVHTLNAFREAGITDVVLCANGYTQAFRRVFGDGAQLGVSLRYSEDQMPRGPAGCVKDAADYQAESDVLVIEGGLLPDVDFGKLIAGGTPDEVMANEHVKKAYLGEEDELLQDDDDVPSHDEEAEAMP